MQRDLLTKLHDMDAGKAIDKANPGVSAQSRYAAKAREDTTKCELQ